MNLFFDLSLEVWSKYILTYLDRSDIITLWKIYNHQLIDLFSTKGVWRYCTSRKIHLTKDKLIVNQWNETSQVFDRLYSMPLIHRKWAYCDTVVLYYKINYKVYERLFQNDLYSFSGIKSIIINVKSFDWHHYICHLNGNIESINIYAERHVLLNEKKCKSDQCLYNHNSNNLQHLKSFVFAYHRHISQENYLKLNYLMKRILLLPNLQNFNFTCTAMKLSNEKIDRDMMLHLFSFMTSIIHPKLMPKNWHNSINIKLLNDHKFINFINDYYKVLCPNKDDNNEILQKEMSLTLNLIESCSNLSVLTHHSLLSSSSIPQSVLTLLCTLQSKSVSLFNNDDDNNNNANILIQKWPYFCVGELEYLKEIFLIDHANEYGLPIKQNHAKSLKIRNIITQRNYFGNQEMNSVINDDSLEMLIYQYKKWNHHILDSISVENDSLINKIFQVTFKNWQLNYQWPIRVYKLDIETINVEDVYKLNSMNSLEKLVLRCIRRECNYLRYDAYEEYKYNDVNNIYTNVANHMTENAFCMLPSTLRDLTIGSEIYIDLSYLISNNVEKSKNISNLYRSLCDLSYIKIEQIIFAVKNEAGESQVTTMWPTSLWSHFNNIEFIECDNHIDLSWNQMPKSLKYINCLFITIPLSDYSFMLDSYEQTKALSALNYNKISDLIENREQCQKLSNEDFKLRECHLSNYKDTRRNVILNIDFTFRFVNLRILNISFDHNLDISFLTDSTLYLLEELTLHGFLYLNNQLNDDMNNNDDDLFGDDEEDEIIENNNNNDNTNKDKTESLLSLNNKTLLSPIANHWNMPFLKKIFFQQCKRIIEQENTLVFNENFINALPPNIETCHLKHSCKKNSILLDFHLVTHLPKNLKKMEFDIAMTNANLTNLTRILPQQLNNIYLYKVNIYKHEYCHFSHIHTVKWSKNEYSRMNYAPPIINYREPYNTRSKTKNTAHTFWSL